MAGVKILYEDQAAGPIHEYGPHNLVCWLLWDRVREAGSMMRFHEIGARVRAFPKKGVDKVRSACVQDLRNLANDGSLVIALVDNDRIREHLDLQADACRSRTTAAFCEGCADADRLRVVLLEKNMESVVAAVREALGEVPVAGKPTPLERDKILRRICGELAADKRRSVASRVSSLSYLIQKIDAELKLTTSPS